MKQLALKYLSVIKGSGPFHICSQIKLIIIKKENFCGGEWRGRSSREKAWQLLELTDVFIYTKSKSFLLPAGFITKITMPLFCKFIQRKLEKIFKPLSELSPPPFNLKLVFKYTTTKKFNNPAKLLQIIYIIRIMLVLWNYMCIGLF